MSDDDHEVDVESDYDDDSDARHSSTSRNSLLFTQEDEDSDTRHSALSRSGDLYSQAEKRAHHNALERKRRDHIKDSFSSLRKSVPTLSGEKASRAQILRKAADYIILLRKRNVTHQKEIQDLKRQNSLLEEQVRILEAAAKKRKTLSVPMLESEIDSDLSC